MFIKLPSSIWQPLRFSWLAFVRSERQKDGLSSFLPSFHSVQKSAVQCYCGKSAISFPHWPPTSYDEAIEQLRFLLGKQIGHRKYLASQWLAFVNQNAFLDSSPDQSARKWYRYLADMIEARCPIFVELREMEEKEELQRYARLRYCKALSCTAFCQPSLNDPDRFCCLCHCRHHREVCPVHRTC